MFLHKNITEAAHFFVAQWVKPGDSLLDATLGNGRDTLFLARLTGPSGKVYGFDIQSTALDKTQKLLQANHINPNAYQLFLDSHSNIARYGLPPLKAAMFNLGYMPGGDHHIVTEETSTVAAIQQLLPLVLPGGGITVTCYPGHPEGACETEAVKTFVSSIRDRFTVVQCTYVNRPNNPPLLFIIEKAGSEPA